LGQRLGVVCDSEQAEMNKIARATFFLVVQVSLAQRAKWNFKVSPFDYYFVCSTQSNIEQSMALCEANCRAGENLTFEVESKTKIDRIALFSYRRLY
jgi:hypothetical protein